jgi:hypothetical protein
MRLMLLAAAGAAALAGPAAAQDYRYAPAIEEAGPAIDEIAPAMDRATQALLNLDLGPILDAVDPMRPHPHRTLRDMARRDDPDFERNLRSSIYGSAASLHRMTAAAAAAEPALRQALDQFRAGIAAAMDAPYAEVPPRGYSPPPDDWDAVPMEAPPLPPGEVDEDWDRDLDEDPPAPEPYDE